MNVKSVEKLEKSRVALTIEASAEELEAAVEKVYKKERGKIMVPGFRKGHAPRKIIEKMYGEYVFTEDAIQDLWPDLFIAAVEQEKLDTVSYPEVEDVQLDKENGGFNFKASVAIRPEVTLGQYKGLTAPKEEVTVTDEDVQHEMDMLINRATTMQDVDRAAALGDTVNIDYKGFMDGTPFEGGAANGTDLELGSGNFIPGFEDQLVGAKAGDDREVKVTFPADYHAEELAGKEAVFQVKVHTVKEKVLPTVDDEFAKDVSEFETLAELKEDMKKKITERKENTAKQAFEEALLEQVTDNMTVEIPDAMIELRAENMLKDYAQRVTAQGIPFDKYLAMTGLTEDILKQQATEGATEGVKVDLAMGAIAAAEGITVTDEDIEEEIKKLAETYHMTAEQVKKYVPLGDIRNDLTNQRAAAIVYESATVGALPEEKPKKKAAAKKTTKKAEDEETEEPKKKPAAKKTTKKAEGEEAAEPKKKPAAKKTTKKVEKTEE